MRRIPIILLGTTLLILNMVWASNLSVHFIDVGQGDATLILYENWTILIDSGDRFNAQRDKMQSYIAELNITTINLAIATHADADHIGQFTNLMNTLTIEEFWVNGLNHTSQTWVIMDQTIRDQGIIQHVIQRGIAYPMGDVLLYALGPIYPLFEMSLKPKSLSES